MGGDFFTLVLYRLHEMLAGRLPKTRKMAAGDHRPAARRTHEHDNHWKEKQ